MSETFELVYDVVTRRPACVLIQAGYGCPSAPVHEYDSRLWHTFPTENMRRVTCTMEQVRKHAAQLNSQGK